MATTKKIVIDKEQLLEAVYVYVRNKGLLSKEDNDLAVQAKSDFGMKLLGEHGELTGAEISYKI